MKGRLVNCDRQNITETNGIAETKAQRLNHFFISCFVQRERGTLFYSGIIFKE